MLCKQLVYCLLAVIGIVAGGCGSENPRTVRVMMDVHAKIVAGEHIAIILSHYRREGVEAKELTPVEATFEQCIQGELKAAHQHLTFVSAKAFRKLAPENTSDRDSLASPESLLRLLTEPSWIAHFADARVRYVVLLDASYSTSPARWKSGGEMYVIVVGKEWTEDAVMEGVLLDLKHSRIAGSVRTRSVDVATAGAGLFVVFPFPIYYSASVESTNCKALGKELATLFDSNN